MEKMNLRRTNKKETSDSEQSSDSSEHSLKKGNPSISELADNSTRSNKRSGPPIEDDSLADFKLPKLNSRFNLARNGVKLLDNPKKSTRTRSNPSRNSKKKAESNQMSIESSFFQPPTAFACPLCLKSFNESSQQIAHSKNCAVKNKISTRQLIAATELHERQAEERKAIGLPAAPIQQQPAKKTPKFKRMSTSNDPDVELAIALSKSLSEAQEMEDLEEAVVLAAESNEKILEMSSSQRKSTLINFGFITNKPVISDCTEKSKKKKMGPTILQTRTEEVRGRLLAERIAEAIIDNVIATQRPISPDSMNEKYEDKIINFKSTMLKEMYKSDCKLWNGSVGEESIEFYYIESLCKFIRPAGNHNKRKSEDKLSINRNEDDNDNKIKSTNEKDCVSLINKNENEVNDIQEKQDLIFNLLNNDEYSITNEQIIENTSKNGQDRERKDEKSLKEDQLEGLNSLALSWSKMINSKIYSDVIIHVKHGKFIFSHFLVLWTRCREIEKDFISNNTDNSHSNNESKYNTESLDRKQQWKIMWEDVEYQAGVIFLEFIYCGCIMSLEALKDRLILNDVKKLVYKYKVKELNGYLEKFEIQIKNLNTESQIMENNKEKNNEHLYTEQNEDKNEEYSSPKRDEEQNPSIEEDKNEISKSNENPNTDFQFESSEFSVQVINDNDINVQEKDDDSVNKINTNGSSTKNQEATVIAISEDELELSEMPKSATKTYKNELLRASFMSVSPDIFDGMETMNFGNSFGRKHQNNRDSDNYTVERCLGNDHDLSTYTELISENKGVIKEHEEEITKKTGFQSSEEKYLDGFTRTVEEDSEKQELNVEKNCSASKKILETNNQVTNKDDGCEKLSKSISATRNNLSLFIEKIQRRNARFLESDTDEDNSVIMYPRKKKNPFKIGRLSDNDSGLLSKFRRRDLIRQEEENLETNLKVKKKSALSIFEDDIRKRVATEMEKRTENETHLLKHTQDDDLQESFAGCNSDIEFVDEHWSDIKDNSETELKERKEENQLKVDQKSTHEFDSILANDLSFQTEETNSDEANESMYTKYKKAHKRNSIDKYRTALKNYFDEKLKQVKTASSEEESNNESSEDDLESVENIEKSQHSSPEKSFKVAESLTKDKIIHEEKHDELSRNKRISFINQKNLTELSSFDFYEIEDTPGEGRTEDENSTQNSQEVINPSIDLTVTSDEEKSTETNQKLNEDELSIRKSSNEQNSMEDREMYEVMHEKSFDSMDWNEGVEANYLSKQNDFNDKSRKQPDDKDYSLIVKSNWEPHPPKVDWKNERSNDYSFTEFTGTPTVTENVTKILQECGILDSSYQSKDKAKISIADILSPIVLSSATDSDDENGVDDLPDNLFLDFGCEIEDNANDNYDQNNEEMNFTRLEYEGGANTDFAELSNLRLSTHLPITSSTQYSKTPPVISRALQMSRRSKHDISSDEEEAKSLKSRRCSSVSPLKNKSQRLLQVKSQSEGNFSNSRRSLGTVQSDEKTKNSKRKRNNQKNEEICHFLGLSHSKVDISFDVSPKECYDQLSSPELKRRLASFGLKNQERHRAVKLLNFIWDQMHPLVPENLIPDNVSDNHSNLDNNKHNNLETNLHNKLQQINEEDSSEDDSKDEEVNRLHRTGFPEEFEFSDDCDDNDNANNDENQLEKKLQQNFEKLLEKDNILHRKILMYEPISLNIFAEKLKESGFQVKPKILTDFLNSECISFFIEAPKKWSGNIRKNRKK